MADETAQMDIERMQMEADLVCVGFGPATGGFLTTLSRALMNEDGTPALESRVMPGMPLQVLCYERADDTGFGVSGVVTLGRGIRESLSEEDLAQIPMTAPVTEERVLYLLDPVGASRRSRLLKLSDRLMRSVRFMLPCERDAFRLPYVPPFLRKHDGLLLSIGQFNQWVAMNVMGTGLAQVWPGTPVAEPLITEGRVEGVRLADQGVDRKGNPEAGFMPGMDIKAALTVVADGPVGPVGRALDDYFGLPEGHHQRDWAVGMKAVVDLPEGHGLQPGTVFHTFGYPEPEIFGFLYVYPDNAASLGIFVPSWLDCPVRSAYRYLQHWMQHPYIWRYLQGGRLRSWGAKTLQEAGRHGEPHLVGDGYARIGEGSGSTNVLAGSGVDEAWTTGVQLAEAAIELVKAGKDFSRQNLEETYVRRRRDSWVEREARIAEKSRDGFNRGFITGMIGMGLAGFSRGHVSVPGKAVPPHERVPSLEEYYEGVIPRDEIDRIRRECQAKGASLHDALMERAGWPEVKPDGELILSHQDALLLGGKVQAPDGYADHVEFVYPNLCETCGEKLCVEMCSGQAITANPEGGVPLFDREKCVHCGACIWNCARAREDDPEKSNIAFRAGAGGLHSAEN